ncbi:MAG: Stp1/IreP family PP2C-type Ser/Thr phosphatase [Clostridia bacterium]|nr:Stp1/IreP family PP2C-type Ser/Thr phosphatase [Clostridia bacterium]
MRKFKISTKAARRMLGLEAQEAPQEPPAASEAAEKPKEAPASVRVTTRTDVGLVRQSNQDVVILGQGLIGVADGMGGHKGGETASAGAREGLLRSLEGKEPAKATLEDAVKEVNLALWNQQKEEESLSGMGTTLSVIWPAKDRMIIAHVGDSRVYLWREGKLRQVTRDHSMVADMVRKGLLTEEQAAVHPMRNYITRAVGTEPTIQVDTLELERQQGDRWLVCSDGLHGLVEKAKLESLMAEEDMEEAADQMVREALEKGGRDNISLALAWDEAPAEGEVAE